jgi:hypothetical protein
MGEELELSATPIDYGHDVTLIRENLRYSPEERIRRQAQFANGLRRLQRELGVTPRV